MVGGELPSPGVRVQTEIGREGKGGHEAQMRLLETSGSRGLAKGGDD